MDQNKLAEAIAAAANTDRGELLSGFLSKHFGTDQKFNETNTGIGYKHPSGWMGGVYQNSVDRPSVYFGREFATDVIPNKLQAALMLGGVTGYGKPVNALALPELIYKMDQDRSIAAGLIPPVKNVTPATLAIQMRKRF